LVDGCSEFLAAQIPECHLKRAERAVEYWAVSPKPTLVHLLSDSFYAVNLSASNSPGHRFEGSLHLLVQVANRLTPADFASLTL
jgi:hypothetical protein